MSRLPVIPSEPAPPQDSLLLWRTAQAMRAGDLPGARVLARYAMRTGLDRGRIARTMVGELCQPPISDADAMSASRQARTAPNFRLGLELACQFESVPDHPVKSDEAVPRHKDRRNRDAAHCWQKDAVHRESDSNAPAASNAPDWAGDLHRSQVHQWGQHLPTLKQLHLANRGKVSDKWESYLDEYERLFSHFRLKALNLLEIGVQNGGSLEVWDRYFPLAQNIVGCDINKECEKLNYEDPRISVIVGDVNSDAVNEELRCISDGYDLIIDDGSHTSGDIIRSFCRYFNLLADGGLYIIEDLHCSYWAKWGGGLDDPTSSLAFLRELIDIINVEHWRENISEEDRLKEFFDKYDCWISKEDLSFVHTIQFGNSLCAVTKRKRGNLLGERVVTGNTAIVEPVLLEYRRP